MKYISYSKKKTTLAKSILIKGNGKILINNTSVVKYFKNNININTLLIPLIITNIKNVDIIIILKGGGKNSQINAVKIAICKCILLFNFNFYKLFRKLNFLTIDDRKVERKKYGKKKSRKKEQYSKR